MIRLTSPKSNTNQITYNQKRIISKITKTTIVHVVKTIDKIEQNKPLRFTNKQRQIIEAYKVFKSYNKKAINQASIICGKIQNEKNTTYTTNNA